MKRLITTTFLGFVLITIPCCSIFEDGFVDTNLGCYDFVPITFEDEILCVSPDYYEVDGVRTPMGMSEALRIAEEHNAFLPTPAMVDAIWEQADLRLDPITMRPGPSMTSDEYFIRHDQLIDDQMGDREYTLVAGHKKDIVQQQADGRVTIYGWHRQDGTPIQPISSVHGYEYYDYSHGLRLVRYPR